MVIRIKSIDTFIPVYKESEHLESLIRKLLADMYPHKEIFIIIDEPTKRSMRVSEKYGSSVRFILNGKRLGKANVLNKCVKESCGDILLFLDSDITISNSEGDFLSRVAEEMEDTDMLDIKKTVVRDSFLSRMTYYEYVGFNISSWLASRTAGRCPAVNGAAFAMRRNAFESLGGFRKVIYEDLDTATRAFLKNQRFKYTARVEVHNTVFSSWREWFRQRDRWSIAAVMWFREYFRDIAKGARKYPKTFIPSLFILFPSFVLLILNVMTPDFMVYKALAILMLVLSVKAAVLLPFLTLTAMGANVLKNLFAILLSFLFFSVVFHHFARKLGFEFRYHEFFVYYFFYSFLNLMMTLSGILKVFVFPKKIKVDWKV